LVKVMIMKTNNTSLSANTACNSAAAKEFHIVGFPRSGHTWMQHLLADVLFEVDCSSAQDEIIQNLIPDVYQKDRFDKSLSPQIFKSHEMPLPEYQNVIYLIRDGRDVMLSFYHFQKALKQDGCDYFAQFQPSHHEPVTWAQHVEGWLKNPYRANILFVHYEMLHSQPIQELGRICEFLGVQRSKKEISRAIDHASFDSLQAKEKKLGWSNALWPKDTLFFRKGKIGGYEKDLPEAVRLQIEKENGALLRKLGYQVAEGPGIKGKIVAFFRRTHAFEIAASACYIAESILELL
jgi:hypothetical protein